MKLFTDGLDPRTSRLFLHRQPAGLRADHQGPALVLAERRGAHPEDCPAPATPRDPGWIPLPLISLFYKGTFKLTWQVSPRNKLQSVSNFDHYFPINNTDGFGITRESQTRAISFKYFTGLIWESLLSDVHRVSQPAGAGQHHRRLLPQPAAWTSRTPCDFVPAGHPEVPAPADLAERHLARPQRPAFDPVHQSPGAVLEQPAHLGEHNVQLKNNLITQNTVDRSSVPGDMIYEFNGPPEALTTYYSNDPRLEPARYGWYINASSSLRNVISLTDAWRPTRHLTVTPGAAFTLVRAGNSRGGDVIRAPPSPPAWQRPGTPRPTGARCCAAASTSTWTPRSTRWPVTPRAAGFRSAAAGTRRADLQPRVRLLGRPLQRHRRPALWPHRPRRQRAVLQATAAHPPDLGVHRRRRARGDVRAGAGTGPGLPPLPPPVRAAGDQPHLERVGQPARQPGRLPQRAPADGERSSAPPTEPGAATSA